MVPEAAWQIAIDSRGEIRERRAGEACPDWQCAHRKCWIEEAHVTELTPLLREGPGGDRLAAWPEKMRIFAPRERPHPGAQLALGRGHRPGLAADQRPGQRPLTSTNLPRPGDRERTRPPGARGTPGHPARQPGCSYARTPKSRSRARDEGYTTPVDNALASARSAG